MAEWTYHGDMNVENGGFWIKDEGDADYVNAAELIPCADAGGPEGLYVLERGSIYMPEDSAKRKAALDCVGVSVEEATRYDLAYAFKAYWGIERQVYGGETVIRVGKAEESGAGGWSPEPDVIKPWNTNLRRFIEEEYLD